MGIDPLKFSENKGMQHMQVCEVRQGYDAETENIISVNDVHAERCQTS
jgi:hypothetical protein